MVARGCEDPTSGPGCRLPYLGACNARFRKILFFFDAVHKAAHFGPSLRLQNEWLPLIAASSVLCLMFQMHARTYVSTLHMFEQA